jgi:hypothetical protein
LPSARSALQVMGALAGTLIFALGSVVIVGALSSANKGETTRDEAAMTSSSKRGEGGVAKLKDVADAASVSMTAVSRYLGGTLSLPQATAARIDAAVRRLDYRPNPHARNLSRGRSETLGLVVPDIANPFFARMAAEIEAAADLQGYGLLLCVTLQDRSRV